MKYKFFVISFFIICVFNAFGAGNKEPNFVIANGTGYTIKTIEIRPAARDYPRNNVVFSFAERDIVDKGFVEIFLGDDMVGYSSFDIAIQYDREAREDRERLRWIRTRDPVKISSGRDIPVFSLSVLGESNTLANVAVGAAAGFATPMVIGIVASAIVGAPVVVVGGAVFAAVAIVTGAFVGFSPFVSQNLVVEELGDYRRLRRTLGR
jgi:hypothetical protein